ncbi:MAG: electron transfer flavoprotein subunit alpha/FixB family protein [Gaiellales bacterium]
MTVLVWAEHDGTQPDEVSLQAVALARGYADAAGEELHAALIGESGSGPAAALGAHGVADAHVITHEGFRSYAPAAWARGLCGLAEHVSVSAIIAPGTDRGNEVMAHVGAMLDLPMAANCTAATPGDPASVTRLRWGGSLLEEAALHGTPTLLTVAPHTVEAGGAGGGEATVATFTPALEDADLVAHVTERVSTSAGGGVSLAEAKVVISAGRGAGSAEGFAGVEEVGGLLGGVVGCSRAVTIAGWRPHTDQVGQTGTKIAPDIYIACGISGATQHMAGCKGAKRILAINTDPEAPIMTRADYAVVGDLHEVVPAITAELRKVRGS